MASSLVSLLLLTASAPASGHGAITVPAMRRNPSVSVGYCPYCQGLQHSCTGDNVLNCHPPSSKGPCWGATSHETVRAADFGSRLHDKKAKDGSYWIDQDGSSSDPPLWCPGEKMKIRYYINADHNGVWHWESQLAAPGQEVEGKFRMITNRTSVNNYNKKVTLSDGSVQKVMLANYFSASDGTTPIAGGFCNSGEWDPLKPHCMDDMFAETTLELPMDLPAGETVMRWAWYGGTNEQGQIISEESSPPEKSLFVNCKDVVVGTMEQCSTRGLVVF